METICSYGAFKDKKPIEEKYW